MKTLWQHCHVATMANGKYSIIEDAAMVTAGSLIESELTVLERLTKDPQR